MRSVSGTSRREFLQTAAACTLGAAAAAQSSSLLANALARKIKVGQIGLAHAHASKIEAYIKSSDYDVIGVAEESADLKRNAAMQPLFQGMPWLTRDQLLNWPKLEVVLVETDIDHLLEEARACIKAGKHIHLDKPAGHSLPEFEALLREAEERKLMVQMGYMYRYNPGFLLLQEFLQNGWLGEIFEVHAVMSKVVDPINRTKHGKYAGGMMFELGCHLIDLVVKILGEPTDVHGYLNHAGAQKDALMDNTLAVLEYPRAIATVRSTGLEVDGGSRRHLLVCGTEGTFQIQPLDNPLVKLNLNKAVGKYPRGSSEVTLPKYTRYTADAADMAKVIRGEKTSDYSYAHDLAVQRTLLKACGM